MRKLDELAAREFGGDVNQTLEHLFYHGEKNCLDEYVDEMTSEEARFVVNLVKAEAVKHYGGEEGLRQAIKNESRLEHLKMTHAQVVNAPKTLFLRRLLRDFLIFAAVIAGVALFVEARKSYDLSESVVNIVSIAAQIGVYLMIYKIGYGILNCFRFGKTRRYCLEHPEEAEPAPAGETAEQA